MGMPNSDVTKASGNDPYKEEIAQLRALLEQGGLDGGVLEGRYLNQLKRARQLGVQLESEKAQNRQLLARVAALEAERQQENRSKGGSEGVSRSRVKQAEGGASEESGEQQNNNAAGAISALRERLERMYLQLNESKVQLDEQKKETHRLRKILQQEVGGTPEELEAMLKNTAEGGGGGGWRGRAQQIVVLKSKVKELERAMAAAAAQQAKEEEGGSGSNGGGNAEGRAMGAASVTTDITTARGLLTNRNRDMDDVARERVVELQNRRLLQQRELQDALDRRAAEVEVQRRRAEAAQARHVNLEADNRTLREYLQAVMEKTENDNALIDAYREEMDELQRALHAAKVELQEWEAWDGRGQSKGGGGGGGKPKRGEPRVGAYRRASTDALDADTAVALAGADLAIELNHLKLENAQLRGQLARVAAMNNNSGGGGGTGGESSATVEKSHDADDDTALVLHWLRSVAPVPAEAGAGASGSNDCRWQARVADVLRRAHGAVCLLEQQRQEENDRLSKCYEMIRHLQDDDKHRGGKVLKKNKSNEKEKGKEDGPGADTDEETGAVVNVILQENRALKQRVKMLQELMESERMAYESLRTASTPSLPAEAARGEGGGGSTAADPVAFQQLQRQYEELRVAFNNLQKESLRRGGA
ncbi:putative coiled-coil domain-containing protein 13 isoform X1 [Trypanosoma grayi]|uniref:putative coiled-coil domain-containing protein 13 isoform X1 n=1 Tax=Trypanosoma grayi TaxID=71804 RepID=UPI0004F418C1|nr:putative coiled-coil domain-containing protein 13 isoform X1 [Trypanosoma grayi]KEG08728.1 putative coiled-coil domain-containing protein 13 isoform X1 [Trypanosoma grayi]